MEEKYLQHTFEKRRQLIRPNGPNDRLQRLMRLTLLIIVDHILQGRERRLHRQIPALVALIGDRGSRGGAENVGLSVLYSSHYSLADAGSM